MNTDDLREEILAGLKSMHNNESGRGRDVEGDHIYADDLLCRLLISLGYEDVVEAYERIYKWHA